MDHGVIAVDIKADLKKRLERSGPEPSRLISIISLDNADGTLDLIYMFHRGAEVDQLRYRVNADQELETVSDLFKGALNMEREIIDLFGLRFKGVQGGLLIMPDSGIVAPLRKPSIGQKEAQKDG
jgi:NADH:ubiquinone oxidoreductase subunit C